ncbi:MAG: hypothetical protein ACJ798_09210 [Phenylobacterium sp.]
MTHRTLLLTAAAVAALGLSACERAVQQPPATGAPIASLPLAQATPPAYQPAPAADQLPPGPPLRRARPNRPLYAYVDDAYMIGDAFGDSPPDYTVDYDGTYPWVWRSSYGAYRVAEETPYGWREYYYRGDADYPFLVRDADYAYAYDGPELVAVYDAYGRPYSNYAPTLLDYAARYFLRGQGLYDAAVHRERRAAYAADWRANRGDLLAVQQQWAAEQQRNDEWRQWREQSQAQDQQRQVAWNQERSLRQAYAARMAPLIAAAPAIPQPRREPTPAFAVQQRTAEGYRGGQGGFAAQPQQQILRTQAAERNAFEQRRLAEESARLQQRGQMDRFRQDRLEQQADMARANDVRAQQRFQAEAANRQFAAERGRAREEAGRRQQAEQARQAAFAQRAEHEQRAQAERAAHDQQQRAFAERAQRQQQAEAEQAGRERQAFAARAQHEQQAQAQAMRAQREQQAQAERAGREQQAQAARAQREQQAQAQAMRAQREQQAQAEHAQRQQQAEAARAQHEQQAQAENARRAAEQQQRQAQAAHAAQAQAAQAAAQHGQPAAAQAGEQHGPGGGNGGGPHGQSHGHGKPEK